MGIRETATAPTTAFVDDEYGTHQESDLTEVFIRFPIHCPICKQEGTAQRTKSEILDALAGNKPIRVYAECHDWHWNLDESERKELAVRAKI